MIAKIYHYYGNFKDKFMIWIGEYPFSVYIRTIWLWNIWGVDRGKLPILHSTWCKNFEYPYRVSSKKDFVNIYSKVCDDTYETKNYWFNKIKTIWW